MKADRFLIGIVVGVVVLIAVALALFLTRRTQMEYIPDNTPEGVVQNYVLALHKKEYARAYAALADMPNKPGYDEFRQFFMGQETELNNYSLQIGATQTAADGAVIDCTLIHAGGGPFGNINRQQVTVKLILSADKWKISEMPYAYWNYGWFQPFGPAGKPLPAPNGGG